MDKAKDIVIYFDMDGVLVDFQGYVETHGIGYVPQNVRDKEADERMWDGIKKVERFYYQLEPMPGVLELFRELNRDYRCEILTAIPKPHWGMAGAAEDKKEWIAKYLGADVPVHIVFREQKKDFAKGKNHILIDDLAKNVAEWEMYGGTGILFEGVDKCDVKGVIKNYIWRL